MRLWKCNNSTAILYQNFQKKIPSILNFLRYSNLQKKYFLAHAYAGCLTLVLEQVIRIQFWN